MWGNRLGWSISVLIIALTLWAISLVKASGEPSPPTAQFKADASALAPLTLPAAPTSVVPMSEDCDAADHYRKVIETYEAAVTPDRFIIEAPLFDDFPKNKKFTKLSAVPADVLAKISAIADDDLIPATHCKTCNLFVKKPQEVINYQNWEDREPLIALKRTGNAVLHLALLKLTSKDARQIDEAWKYFDAVFALGAKLEQERLVYQEYYIGVSLMSGAAHYMADERCPDPARRGAAQAFISQYNKYVAKDGPVDSKWHFVSSIDPNNVAEHSGNVFYLARNSADRMWRVESILKLGRIRYIEGPSRGDQTGAIREIKKLATDSDPIIRTAGIAARDLTRDENFKGH